jgi:hypothetical protein
MIRTARHANSTGKSRQCSCGFALLEGLALDLPEPLAGVGDQLIGSAKLTMATGPAKAASQARRRLSIRENN